MRSPAILAAVGMATAASAQSDGWIFEFDQAELSPANPTAWATLSATFPAADYAFAGARLSVSAGESGWGLLETIIPRSPPPSPPVVIGGDITGIIVGQVHFPPPILADPSNPVAVWRGEFTVTDFAPRDIEFTTDTGDFRVYPDPESPASRVGTPVEALESIRVVPAPASLALLGLGGLAAVRRRRSTD